MEEKMTVTIYLKEYRELIAKATLYEEIAAGRLMVPREPKIIGESTKVRR